MRNFRIVTVFIGFISLFLFTGCAENAIYHAVVQGYHKMTERLLSFSDVGLNDARLILYWPEKSFIQGVSVRIMVDGDNGSMHSDVGYRTAELIDLPAGIYHFGLYKNDKRIQLNALPGTVYCYNVTEIKKWTSEEEDRNQPQPVQIEECIQDFPKDDIRCAHKECLVKTVVPKKSGIFRAYHQDMGHEQLENEARNFKIDDKVSRVYITRKMYTLGWVRVGLDGKPEVKVDSSSFVVYEVEPGEHTVVAAIGGPHNIQQAYRLSAKPGQCYFFHSDSFKFLLAEEGKKLVNDYDLVNEGFLKQ